MSSQLTADEIAAIDTLMGIASDIDSGNRVLDTSPQAATPAAALVVGLVNLAVGLYNAFGDAQVDSPGFTSAITAVRDANVPLLAEYRNAI